MTDLQKKLFELQDLNYKAFHQRLIPTIAPERIIGIRTPDLRKFSKNFAQDNDTQAFLNELPHKYYEENNLHAFIIEKIKDYDKAMFETEKFLPYIDNWATCDMFKPKVFSKNTDKLILKIDAWLESEKTYTVRYGIGLLMSYYLDENFKTEYLEIVSKIRSQEYYVNMMIAWYFATALAKQYDSAVKFLEDFKLDKWVHNKTIQKSAESNRISPEKTAYLKTLKIK